MRLQTSKTKNAESFYIVESIYVDGKRSNKVVKKLGTLEQIIEKIGPDKDPYEWGREQAKLLTQKMLTLLRYSPSDTYSCRKSTVNSVSLTCAGRSVKITSSSTILMRSFRN